MKNAGVMSGKNERGDSGAALVTVLMISVILGIACIALLSSLGANSRNSTDVLSETKAYYAAESGLQRAIHILRGNTDTTPNDPSDDINYKKATATSTSNYSGDPSSFARLSAWIPYNYPLTGVPDRVVVGDANTYDPLAGSAYSLVVSDPDNSAVSLTFYTSGKFLSGGTISPNGKTIYYPNNTSADYIEITITDAPSTVHTFAANPLLATINMTTHGNGAIIPDNASLEFRIDYNLTNPQSDTRSIYGSIKQGTVSGAPKLVTFQTQIYKSLGSTIELCSATSGGPNCADVSFNLTSNPTGNALYAYITPVDPYRLKILATGYGPNGAKKQLEGIIQRNLLNGISPGGLTTMIGTSTPPAGSLPFLFVPGNSNGVTYSGGNCSSSTGCVPSFALTDPANLQYVQDNPPRNGTMNPPPALLDPNNTPAWQQSPAALDALIDQLRTSAINSTRRFVSPSGNIMNPGDYTTGTGITFCEGSCKVAGSGGGILVVTGKLTNLGGFQFKGLIIVTGEEGWERTGGGGGQIVGNVVIAPYNKRTYVPENLSATFLAPRYYISGGGASDIIYGDITANFDNTSAISDFMLGIAEK